MLEILTKTVFALTIVAAIVGVGVFVCQIIKGKKQNDKSQMEAAKLGLQMAIPVSIFMIAFMAWAVTSL